MIRFLTLTGFLMAMSPTLAAAPSAGLEARRKSMNDLLAEHWEYTLSHSPEFASILGDKRWNDKVTDFSQEDAFNENERYPKVMAVHLTSVERLGGPFGWEVAIPRGVAGLSRSSVVKCTEISTLWKEQLQGPAATLPGSLMRSVDAALAIALGLGSTPVAATREQE
jgi:mRNA-degrading endonuclease toxin of MazEF toxin-antitoxin module